MTHRLTSQQLRNKRTRNQRLQPKQTKPVEVLPFGSSYMDFLPDDVSLVIFKMKHTMEFAPTLKMINMFRCVFEDTPFRIRMTTKTLLKPISKRTFFHIDVEEYMGNIEFRATTEQIKKVEERMNIKIQLNKPDDPLRYMSYRDKYTDARIKWLNKQPALVLDIINISKSLGLKCLAPNHILESLLVEDINRKKDDIMFKFV